MAQPQAPPPGFADAMASFSNQLRDLEREVKKLRRDNASMRQQLLALGVAPLCDAQPQGRNSPSPVMANGMLPGQAPVQGHLVQTTQGLVYVQQTPITPVAMAPQPLLQPVAQPMVLPSPVVVPVAQRAAPTTPTTSPPVPQPDLRGHRLVRDLSKRESPREIRFLGLPLVLESQLPQGAQVIWPGGRAEAEPGSFIMVVDGEGWVLDARWT